MKIQLRNLLPNISDATKVRSILSLNPFIRFLEDKVANKEPQRMPFFNVLLTQIKNIPDSDQPISLYDLRNYESVFEMIYYTFVSPISEEKNEIWALGYPFLKSSFFGIDTFYDFFGSQPNLLEQELIDTSEDHVQKRLEN